MGNKIFKKSGNHIAALQIIYCRLVTFKIQDLPIKINVFVEIEYTSKCLNTFLSKCIYLSFYNTFIAIKYTMPYEYQHIKLSSGQLCKSIMSVCYTELIYVLIHSFYKLFDFTNIIFALLHSNTQQIEYFEKKSPCHFYLLVKKLMLILGVQVLPN